MPNLKHLPLTGSTINWFLKYSEYRTSELSMYMCMVSHVRGRATF